MAFFKKQKTQNQIVTQTTQYTKAPLIQNASIAIMDVDQNRLGEGTIQTHDTIEHTVTIIRKTGELALPCIPEETQIETGGCNRNTPFTLNGSVMESTKTKLVLKDVEITQNKNRRTNFRVEIEEKATITATEPDALTIDATISDISVTGARITCQKELPIGSVIRIKALLTNRERKWRVDTDAEILRMEEPWTKNNKTYYTYGILFPQFNDKELSKFTQWLNMLQASARKI